VKGKNVKMFQEQILISILVPIYNVSEYLERCIDSIINQTYKNIEIILIDDGSTDASGKICDAYAQNDSRIVVIHKTNGGTVSARKAGTRKATGEYVICVDGDDWIEKDRVMNLVEQGIKYHTDMVYMDGHIREYRDNSVYCHGSLRRGFYSKQQVKDEILNKIASTNHFYAKNVDIFLVVWAFKRELIKEKQELIDDRISMGEDLICVCECLSKANSVFVIENGGYHYTQFRRDSASYGGNHSNVSNLGLKVLWNQLKQFAVRENIEKKMYRMLVMIMSQSVAMTDYSIFLKKQCNFLYPYSKVKEGSDIIIYGAGKLGFRMMEALSQNNKYNIVAWVDKSNKRFTFDNYTISDIKALMGLKYDYIVIAILNYDIAWGAYLELKNIGVEEEKIALMDADVISEDFLIFEEGTVKI